MIKLFMLRFFCIADRIKDYKLRHLKLGRLISSDRDNPNHGYSIKGTARDVHWQTDIALAVIIRDYLRDRGRILLKQTEITEAQWNGYAKKWEAAVNKTADEFDELIKMTERIFYSDNYPSEEELKSATEKAFKDLAFIFNDLCW